MNRELLSQKLKELRIVNNYTQDYVAAALGVVRQTYSHYETGRRVPDAEVLYKLSGLYNISVDDLLHITMDVDRDESYDAPVPSASSTELFIMNLRTARNICLPLLSRRSFFTILRK